MCHAVSKTSVGKAVQFLPEMTYLFVAGVKAFSSLPLLQQLEKKV